MQSQREIHSYVNMQKSSSGSEHESEERKKKRKNSKKYDTHASNAAHFGATRGESNYGSVNQCTCEPPQNKS